MKRFLSLFLFAILFGSYAFSYDFSAVCSTGQTLYYNITSATEPYSVEVTYPFYNNDAYNPNYYYNTTKPTGDLTIPSYTTNNGITYSVTSIGNCAFKNCSDLTSVIIPNSVTSTGYEVFSGCSGLTSVTIPNSVTNIGQSTFLQCSNLSSITIPNSVTSIGLYAFSGCSSITEPLYNANCFAYFPNGYATEYTIPDGINQISGAAFRNCNELTLVTIPNSVTSIDGSAFYNCSGMTSITIPNSVTNIGRSAFYNCSGLTSVIIPNSVTNIEGSAFENCNGLTEVTIGSSVTSIGGYAFKNCSGLNTVNFNATNCTTNIIGSDYVFHLCSVLRTINIGNNVTNIPDNLFYGCQRINSITIPNSVVSIGFCAFYNCSGLTELSIGESVASIGNCAFYGCSGLTTVNFNATNCMTMGDRSNLVFSGCTSLATLNIGESVTNIPAYAFCNCSGLTSVTIPNSVTSIGEIAFGGCAGLTTINFNAINCTSMGSSSNPVFSGCTSLATLTIGNNVTNIPASAFYNCRGLTSVTIPNSVTSIGNQAFCNCSGLTEVTIGNSVTSIGELAFYNCDGLSSITIPNSVTSIGGHAFYGCNNLATVIFNATNCTTMGNTGYLVFNACTSLSTLIIGNNVTYIPAYAFNNCNGLRIVNFNATNCTSMGSSSGPVFNGCNANATINIGESVTTIPDYAFKGLIGSGTLTIPNSVTSIGQYAFYGCSGFTGDLSIPESVTVINSSTFYKCSGLSSVTIPNTITSIGSDSFYECAGLTEITIPNSVTSIGERAFCSTGLTTVNFNATNCTTMGSNNGLVFALCTSLSTLSIGNNVTNIPARAFYNCSGLTEVTIPNSVTSIGESAFRDCSGLTSVTIGNSVTSIGNLAFLQCGSLTSITIPNSVTSIGTSAFQNCSGLTTVNFNATNCTSMGSSNGISGNANITTLNIGENVANIPNSAFQNCSGLTTINFNATNCTSMGSSSYPVFNGCNANATINIGEGVTTIPDYAFKGLIGSGTLTIPNSVTSIGQYAFYGCNGFTGALTIPNTVTNISTYAFYNCSGLSALTIGSGVASIGSSAFAGCSALAAVHYAGNIGQWCGITFDDQPLDYAHNLYINNSLVTDLVIPENTTEIKKNTFSGATCLTSATIPNTVTNIGQKAFYGCSGLSGTLTVPNSVSSIGNQAFGNCSGLTAVNFNAANCSTMGSSSNPAFGGCTSLATISIGENVRSIPAYAFYNCNSLRTINFNATNCTSFGSNNGISGNTNITTLSIGEIVTNIPSSAFNGCTNITGALAIPNAVTSIGGNAFYNCSRITSLSIPNSVTSIGNSAFFNCSGLASISVGSGNSTYDSRDNCNAIIKKSNNQLLLGCNNTVIPESVKSLGSSAFYNCSALRRVTIPQNITSIANDVFYGCSSISEVIFNAAQLNSSYTQSPFSAAQTSLRKISLGEAVTRIPDYMFAGCTAIDSIVAGPTVPPTVYSSTFDYNHVSSARVLVPCRTADIYNDADFWYNFRRIREVGPCPTIYTVTALSNNNLFGTVTGGGEYEENSTATLSATPNYGYRFTAWNDGNEENPRTISVTNDVTYIATFVEIPPIATYTITALSSNPTIGVVTGGGSYYEGTEVTLTATPSEGYAFISWNDGETLNPRQITVSGDALYIASFIEANVVTNYEVNVASSNLAYGTVSGSGVYSLGNVVEISATAFDGYMFTSWNDGNTDNPRSITVIGNAMYVANFAVIPPTPVYTITAMSINQAYGMVLGGGEYEENAVATLTATAANGYEFTSWNDGNTENPREITVTRDAIYIAYFDELPQTPTYNITVIASNPNHGEVTGSGEYEENAVATLTATAANGYEFTSWNDGNTENPREITVTRDAIYIAYFDALPQTPTYNITVIASNPNHGEVTGSGEYEENAVATLTATAADGYEFTSWNDGNTENPREVTVTRDAIYIAYFEDLPTTPTYNITVIASNPNHGEVTGSGVYEENTEITLTATSFDGYRFDIWSDGNTDSIRTVTVTSDAIYIANFVHIDEAETIYVTVVDTACGSYTWNGVTYTESGTYYRTFTATNSADSIVALGLVILPLPEPVITVDGILDACNQETTSVTLSTGNYSSYNWTTGETSSSIVVTTPGEYYVEVVDSMGCQGNSEGVIVGYSTVLTEAPQIRNLGMNNNGYISLNWTVAQTEGVAGYEVYREDNETNVFRLVKRINNARTKLLIDSAADPSARAYRYKVCAIDSCGGMSPMSEPHKTMHLTINQGIDNSWNLIWSHYEGFELRGYKIIRGTTMANMVEIDVVPSNLNSYTDYSNPYNLGFFYKVMIIKDTRSNDEEEEMLSSNIVDNGHIVMRTVMAAASNPLCGNVTGSGVYPDGTEIVIEATANEGYEFMSWNDGSTQNPRNAIITSDTLFVANFVEIPQVATYNIMVYSSNPAYGTVTGGGTYAEGTEITIAATASSGYEFVSWSDGNSENPRTLIVTEDAMYIATFVEAATVTNYTITVISANPTQGIVTGGGTYPEGTVISIEAIANEGYEFISWNDNNTENPRIITVTADAMFIASFVPATDIEESATTEINVFPNPANDILNITSSETISEIEIVNVMGQVVKRIEINSDNAVCDVEELKAGVYIVRIYGTNTASVVCQRNFVKE